jgi:hypothetical protein
MKEDDQPAAEARPEAPAELTACQSRVLDQVGHHYRDALRLLFILALGSEPVDPSDTRPKAQRVFQGEKRLMAIDFLVRYPDYLADALLDRYQAEKDAALLDVVQAIFDNEEPDVRVVRMVRWQRGAFQNIETALAILQSRHLIRSVRYKTAGGQRRHDVFVEPAAHTFLEGAVQQQSALSWYRERVKLALTVAGMRSGSSLKEDQYLHEEYRNAPYGTEIPSIKDRVLARLQKLRGQQ